MLDIGWWELMVVGILAILVVGPKDLPRMMRTIGQFVAKARGMASEFQKGMSDLADQADLKDLKDIQKDINTIRNPVAAVKDEVKKEFDFSWDKDGVMENDFSKPVQNGPSVEDNDPLLQEDWDEEDEPDGVVPMNTQTEHASELENPVGPPMSPAMRKEYASVPDKTGEA